LRLSSQREDPLKQRLTALARFSSLHFYKTCPEYDRGKTAASLRHLFRKYWLETLLIVLVAVATFFLAIALSVPGPGTQNFPRFEPFSSRLCIALGAIVHWGMVVK
jgi:hypothetical protein